MRSLSLKFLSIGRLVNSGSDLLVIFLCRGKVASVLLFNATKDRKAETLMKEIVVSGTVKSREEAKTKTWSFKTNPKTENSAFCNQVSFHFQGVPFDCALFCPNITTAAGNTAGEFRKLQFKKAVAGKQTVFLVVVVEHCEIEIRVKWRQNVQFCFT